MGELIFSAQGVAFGYRGADRPAVHEVDLDVASGQLVAIVGPNGSGRPPR